MRLSLTIALLLAGCAGLDLDNGPEEPARLAALLESGDPLAREEGAHRLSLLGMSVHEALETEGRPAGLVDQDTASLRERLEDALRERDPERMVWRAYHALRGGCLGRDWRRISEALSRQLFRLVEIYEPHERAKFVRFIGRARAYVNAAGDPHDLFFWVQSVRRDTGWLVREVYVGLHVEFEAPFKDLTRRDRYPQGSVLARFFELEEVRKLAAVYPVLEEIEFSYGRIRDRESGLVPAGFHVNAGFLLAGERGGGGRGIYYTAEAGLDPPTSPRGRLLRDRPAADGPLVPRGASFWGAGGWRPPEEP